MWRKHYWSLWACNVWYAIWIAWTRPSIALSACDMKFCPFDIGIDIID